MSRPIATLGTTSRIGVAFLAVALLSTGMLEGRASTRRAVVTDTVLATLEGEDTVFLEVQAGPRDSYVSLAVTYAGTERAWASIEDANGRRELRAGRFYAIPYELLLPEHRARALIALFPEDGPDEAGWVHRVPESDGGQLLETVALWFTGVAGRAEGLAELNGVENGKLSAGAEIVIPSERLAPGLEQAHADRPLIDPPAPVVAGDHEKSDGEEEKQPSEPVAVGDLMFVPDETGGHAIYRLKRGEALYSAVVLRFTGRLHPKEVSAAAETIASVSGIERVNAIPVGYPIKIPAELLLSEYLPPDDPRRRAHDEDLEAAAEHAVTVRARDLEGVAIILDAGHGGDDIGAQRNGVHEDDYVYDIMCRIKSLAEADTGARVLTTIRDKSAGFEPHDGPFTIDKDEYLLTSPAYHPRKPHASTAGVNLRWYLVNSYYRALLKEGIDPQRVVFVSLHADSRHSSVRGAMAYVPGQGYRTRTYGHVGRLYGRKEVEEARYVKFSRKDRARSEGLSRQLAQRVIRSFVEAGIPIHENKPIRDHVIRGRRRYTPAVIRTSQVPQSVLIEVVNLNNKKDAKAIKDPAFRQKIARAFLEALKGQYGVEARSGGTVATAQ